MQISLQTIWLSLVPDPVETSVVPTQEKQAISPQRRYNYCIGYQTTEARCTSLNSACATGGRENWPKVWQKMEAKIQVVRWFLHEIWLIHHVNTFVAQKRHVVMKLHVSSSWTSWGKSHQHISWPCFQLPDSHPIYLPHLLHVVDNKIKVDTYYIYLQHKEGNFSSNCGN